MRSFRYWQTGIFHLCVTEHDLDGLVARIVANGGRQRTKIYAFLPGRPYRLVYCEDPFGNIIEAFSHSYAETFANMPGWKAIDASHNPTAVFVRNRSEERQRADFDALARTRVRRRSRIVERGVRGPAGAAVFL